MAQKKITDLTLRADFDGTVNLPGDDTSQTWRVTGAQILTWVTAQLADRLKKTGDIIMCGAAAPAGTLACDGTAVSRSTYSALFAVIGTTFGVGNGSTTFNVPDFRNVFPRGANGSTRAIGGITYPAVTLGATTGDIGQGHLHNIDPPSTNTSNGSINLSNGSAGGTMYPDKFSSTGDIAYGTGLHNHTVDIPAFDSAAPKTDGTNGTPRVGSETRPVNLGVNFAIVI